MGLVALAAALGSCQSEPAWDWQLPPGIPAPAVPADNPMNAAKVELGRRLFYDVRLSGNRTQSCASCHAQERAFTDGMPVATGSTGDHTPRNAMGLTNVAYNPVQTWANPSLVSLEDQAMVPIFGEHPVELGLSNMEDELVARLHAEPLYPDLFAEAFPGEADAITIANAVRAIAAFERTMLSFDSPYDRYVYRGDRTALSESALRGLDLFNSERCECFHCHGGFNFTDNLMHGGTRIPEVQFHNTALYNIDGRGGYPAPNRGLFELTGEPRDMGHFRAPTLRNITASAPYMHDGTVVDLNAVLDHYAAGGRTIESGPNAGVGSESPLKNVFLHGFTLSDGERADLLALLESLTDETFLHDPRFADPWR
ncbi:MAG: di-heme enzyme [Sandaracinaceae bacterium]|nr:di-heme enzyme [Sandaracinaceae bacterium]